MDVASVPTGGHESLARLYARQAMLFDEAERLEAERQTLDPQSDRVFILDLEIEALREEATRFSAKIADILERDLQR